MLFMMPIQNRRNTGNVRQNISHKLSAIRKHEYYIVKVLKQIAPCFIMNAIRIIVSSCANKRDLTALYINHENIMTKISVTRKSIKR